MPDPIEEPVIEQSKESVPPAEAKKTEEHMIPKSRLDEVLAQKAQSEARIAEFEKQEEERKNAELSETDRLRKENEKKDKELSDLRLEQMRSKAAKEAGIADYADRLKGGTLEELTADAKKFAETLPKAEKKTVIRPTAPEGGEAKTQTEEQFRQEVFGKPSNPFDPAYARLNGGGISTPSVIVKQEESKDE